MFQKKWLKMKRSFGRYEEQLRMQGIDIKQYYQITNTNEEQLRKQMREEANNHVVYRLMLEEIAKEERLNRKGPKQNIF